MLHFSTATCLAFRDHTHQQTTSQAVPLGQGLLRPHRCYADMPSFAIEVPGEANPLSESTIVNTLRSASSSDPNQIQTGTKQLAQWEKSPGFYRHLQSAYLETRLPVEIRYLAIIQLKNGIDKYWRKTAAKYPTSNVDTRNARANISLSVLSPRKTRILSDHDSLIAC